MLMVKHLTQLTAKDFRASHPPTGDRPNWTERGEVTCGQVTLTKPTAPAIPSLRGVPSEAREQPRQSRWRAEDFEIASLAINHPYCNRHHFRTSHPPTGDLTKLLTIDC